MSKPALVVTVSSLALLSACGTTNSGVTTTPTFAPARWTGPDQGYRERVRAAWAQRRATTARRAPEVRTKNGAIVQPECASARGASWTVRNFEQGKVCPIPMAMYVTTNIPLPEGTQVNATLGNPEDFLVQVSYAGPRPVVSITQKHTRARGDLTIISDGGVYQFDPRINEKFPVRLVDIQGSGEGAGTPNPVGGAPGPAADPAFAVRPQGDLTPIKLFAPEDTPRPAWAPVQAWADSEKLVVTFNTPLPVLPPLFAGGEGEQQVTYRAVEDPARGRVHLVTSRRVTEFALRLDQEEMRGTVDPTAIGAGWAADPAQGADGWKDAKALNLPRSYDVEPSRNVAVVVVPGAAPTTAPASTAHALPPGFLGVPVAAEPKPTAKRTPKAGTI